MAVTINIFLKYETPFWTIIGIIIGFIIAFIAMIPA